jgi:hypothetical protein
LDFRLASSGQLTQKPGADAMSGTFSFHADTSLRQVFG